MSEKLLHWESIDGDPMLCRAKVPGGWLVREQHDVLHNLSHQDMVKGYEWRSALCFVPDPTHEWKATA